MHEFIINNTNLTLDLMIQEVQFINENLSLMIDVNNFESDEVQRKFDYIEKLINDVIYLAKSLTFKVLDDVVANDELKLKFKKIKLEHDNMRVKLKKIKELVKNQKVKITKILN